jgi:hypothetical protein
MGWSNAMVTDYLKQIRDVFSVRHAARGQGYKPDWISERLRQRVLMLYADVLSGRMNRFDPYSQEDHWLEFLEEMHQTMRHLYGRPVLSRARPNSAREDVLAFLLDCSPSEFFDFIELSFKLHAVWRVFISDRENDFVDALNEIFRIEDAQYQITPGVEREEENPIKEGRFSGGRRIVRVAFPRVVRMDDEVAHTEAILPALFVLADPDYVAANEEFRKALEDYRKGDFEDCVAKCGSAFESTLKILCRKNKLPLDESKDTAGPLLDRVLPASSLDTRTFKEPLFVVARLRNRLSSAHGGGSTVRNIPRHVAQYALTSAAAAIALLVHEMGGMT